MNYTFLFQSPEKFIFNNNEIHKLILKIKYERTII